MKVIAHGIVRVCHNYNLLGNSVKFWRSGFPPALNRNIVHHGKLEMGAVCLSYWLPDVMNDDRFVLDMEWVKAAQESDGRFDRPATSYDDLWGIWGRLCVVTSDLEWSSSPTLSDHHHPPWVILITHIEWPSPHSLSDPLPHSLGYHLHAPWGNKTDNITVCHQQQLSPTTPVNSDAYIQNAMS